MDPEGPGSRRGRWVGVLSGPSAVLLRFPRHLMSWLVFHPPE